MCETHILMIEVDFIARPYDTSFHRLSNNVAKQVTGLNEQHQREFLSMPKIYPHGNDGKKYHLRTVSFHITTSKSHDVSSVFLNAGRINHATKFYALADELTKYGAAKTGQVCHMPWMRQDHG